MLIIGDSMKIERWIYQGKEIEIPICEEQDVEVNEVFEDEIEELEKTKDLSKLREELKNQNE